MPLMLHPYDRAAAVLYAHEWAYMRNPRYLNFDGIGGDCTNFASQCLYAGSQIMNFTPTLGWYYISSENRSPSWTGVEYFSNFLLRRENSVGPSAVEVSFDRAQPGDFVQLSFGGVRYEHTPIIVYTGQVRDEGDILVAAHSNDADFRPLKSYEYERIRFLHIVGVWKP